VGAISDLIEGLRRLPGVGAKSAQRMAFHLLEKDRPGAIKLAAALSIAAETVRQCSVCRTLTEALVCELCANVSRDRTKLCVVESPADLHAVETATGFRGLYFVMHGRLSPIDGIGPGDLGFDALIGRLRQGHVEELIVACNPSIEGEATAHFLSELAREFNVLATRISHGVPVGGELEYTDRNTLAHAFGRRTPMGTN
jgi:recombination protein RecR